MPSEHLPFSKVRALMKDFLEGLPEKEIAIKYGTTTRAIKKYMSNLPATRTEVEKKFFEHSIAAENRRIFEIKEKMYNFVAKGFDDAAKHPDKMYSFSKVADIADTIDKTFRLNNSQATSNININEKKEFIDVAKIMEQYKTPEEKKQFLLSRLPRKDK